MDTNHGNEKHLNEEQFVLYYYGEGSPGIQEGVEEHLGECESCRTAYQTLQRVLNSVDSLPVPERGAEYESQVWSAVERRLPRRRAFASRWFTWKPMAAKPLIIVTAMVMLVIAAFIAGRGAGRGSFPFITQKAATQIANNGVENGAVRERVLLVAVGDHLERSQTVLVELANAGAPRNGHLDISYEQRAAEDLLESNRLYRQTAVSTGDDRTASMLEELERVLLEIAHSPSAVSEKQLDELRKQIEDRGIIFKVKVFGKQVEQREAAPSRDQREAAPSSGNSASSL
jgi:hypothetical protein